MKSKQQKPRYAMRNQIEEIIKSKHIDRNVFHEVSKLNWQNIIRKLYYAFCNHQSDSHSYLRKDSTQKNWRYQTDKPDFYEWHPYMWLKIRKDLSVSDCIHEDNYVWGEYIQQIVHFIPMSNNRIFYYLLTDGGWLYEGTLSAIIQVLSDYPANMEEFYLFPKDYSWMIVCSEDAGCMRKIISKR